LHRQHVSRFEIASRGFQSIDFDPSLGQLLSEVCDRFVALLGLLPRDLALVCKMTA
jgi:hypothetical protein